MTEDPQGGSAPERAQTPAEPAIDQTVATVAVADDPATTASDAPSAATPEAATDTAAETPTTGDAAVPQATSESANGAEADETPTVGDAAVPQATSESANGAEAGETPTVGDAAVPQATSESANGGEAADTTTSNGVGTDAAAIATTTASATPTEAPAPPEPTNGAAASVATAPDIEVAPDIADAPPAEPAPRETRPEPTTMEELLAEQDTDIRSLKHGDVVEGAIVRIDKDEILVDIGAKSEGVVSNRELFGRNAENQPQLNIGDTVLVYVLQPESPEGHAVLSLRRAGLERKWRAMQEQFEAGVIIEAPVIDHNKGGLIVDCGIRGFVPISQIVDFPRRPQNEQPRDAAQEIAEKLQPYIGRKLRLKILEVNRKANRLILSEKVALYEERREKRDELFSSLQVGQKVTGNVRSIAPFGVFIDLGGIDGLVHKSELSWNKVNNPEAGYKVGDEVEAEVIDINHERGRISLSIRRLQPDPWESTVADFKVGDVIDGTVTKLVNFGAFVRVREGLEGLIHISELSHQRVAHPGDVVHEGQTLKLKIISLDSERHRLGLSLKQAEEPPARPTPAPEERPRRERRERGERSFGATDAVTEPEGGIDTTLASAFAQVREQVAAAERQAADDDEPIAGATIEAQPAAIAPAETGVEQEPAPDAVDASAETAPEAAVEAPAPEPPVEVIPEEAPGVPAEPGAEPSVSIDDGDDAPPATDDAPESQLADVLEEGAMSVGPEPISEVASDAGPESSEESTAGSDEPTSAETEDVTSSPA